jgi:hypothetical protein
LLKNTKCIFLNICRFFIQPVIIPVTGPLFISAVVAALKIEPPNTEAIVPGIWRILWRTTELP